MKRLFSSFGYALNGLRLVFSSEPNMRIHSGFAVLIILFGFIFDIRSWEWCVILLCIMIVSALEVLNTVVEKYLDFYHPEHSENVKVLKDMSAAAVLWSALISVIIGLLIFLPKIIQLWVTKL
ncbi:diacylglycerol kinase [Flavobacteriaceae bacterium Ap0902]|nr:diacylglycerol kinase [Flavobacteriaceae bacterium Ap0902]